MIGLAIIFVGWGALPFLILATVGHYLRMPKLIFVLGILSLAMLGQLFWDVYVSPKSSTSAIGLAAGPVALSIVILVSIGICALVRSVFFPKRQSNLPSGK